MSFSAEKEFKNLNKTEPKPERDINREFRDFREEKRVKRLAQEELGREVEVFGLRELTNKERSDLHARLESFAKKLDFRMEGAYLKLDKSLRDNESSDLQDKLAIRLKQLTEVREKLKEQQELLQKASEE